MIIWAGNPGPDPEVSVASLWLVPIHPSSCKNTNDLRDETAITHQLTLVHNSTFTGDVLNLKLICED
jgi:hypothetical protein